MNQRLIEAAQFVKHAEFSCSAVWRKVNYEESRKYATSMSPRSYIKYHYPDTFLSINDVYEAVGVDAFELPETEEDMQALQAFRELLILMYAAAEQDLPDITL